MLNIYFKKVVQSDMELLYIWSNDLLTRKMSFQTAQISFEEHQNWFEKNINSDNQYLFIAGVEGYSSQVGFVRIDRAGMIGISLDKKFRGLGLSKHLIAGFIDFLRDNVLVLDSAIITAFIREENIASIKSFENAGFKLKSRETYEKTSCLRYEIKI